LALALALLPVVGWLAGCFALFFVGGVFVATFAVINLIFVATFGIINLTL
jgi:hypothetical protein